MIIGSSFTKKCFDFLQETARLSKSEPGIKLSVSAINTPLKYQKDEIKNIIEYLDELGYLNLETIGGPFLYGHISITEKGLDKLNSMD